jgi:HEAT repeat protein
MKRILVCVLAGSLLFGAAAWAADSTCAEDDAACWIRQLDSGKSAALQAAMKLGAMQSVAAVPSLIKQLAGSDQYLATASLQALIKIGPAAVPELVKATTHKNPTVRRYATYALGKIRGDDAFEALAKAAKDPDKSVRKQTATTLGQLKDPRSMTVLLDLLRDRSAGVRAEAALALGAVGDKRVVAPLIEFGLCDLSPETAAAANEALATIGEPAVEPLIADFNARPSYTRQRMLLTLTRIAVNHPAARARVIQNALWVLPRKNESAETRAAAAYALGSLGAKEAIPALQQALAEAGPGKDENSQKLAAACRMALDKIAPGAGK